MSAFFKHECGSLTKGRTSSQDNWSNQNTTPIQEKAWFCEHASTSAFECEGYAGNESGQVGARSQRGLMYAKRWQNEVPPVSFREEGTRSRLWSQKITLMTVWRMVSCVKQEAITGLDQKWGKHCKQRQLQWGGEDWARRRIWWVLEVESNLSNPDWLPSLLTDRETRKRKRRPSWWQGQRWWTLFGTYCVWGI